MVLEARLNKLLIYLVCLLVICTQTQAPFAQSLPFSSTEAEAIKSAWGESNLPRMMVCGDRTVGMWKKFPGNFFQGAPTRGFLISPPMLSQNFKHIFRATTDYDFATLFSLKHSEYSTIISVINFE
jgi:hypothetical protein